MEGIYFNRGSQRGLSVDTGEASFDLLAKQGRMEIMHLRLEESDTIWLAKTDDGNVLEFFYVHAGALEMPIDGETVRLTAGDSFYLAGLARDVLVKAEAATELLYVTNSPMFDSSQRFQQSLKKLLLQINEKDDYTYRHSGNVVDLVRLLYDHFREECGAVTLDELLVASLFHDVGKCFIPDEVLKKKNDLEPEDIRLILRHPRDSAKLLRPYFGEHVAEIAAHHHERLDGSGYPYGYAADEISFSSRLLAVADVFDAMTTDRGYNEVKGDLESARELCALADQFDPRITGWLLKLVEEGKLEGSKGDTE